jgi:transcriptional regulator with XRE-family HTH domain
MAATKAASRTSIYEGDRQLRRTSARFAEEFRGIRLRAGVSQAAVARAIGVTRSVICRMERGDPGVSPQIRARAASVLGADFRMAIYPEAAPLIHDAAHARMVEAILALRNAAWRAKVEAPVPGPGRRSSDIRLDHGPRIVLIEVESRVHALEAIIRECADKRAAVSAVAGLPHRVHVVVALPRTRHHRALVTTHPEIMAAAFPASSAALSRALRDPTIDWPGDGILWVPSSRRRTENRHRA